jgi:hypothetical protein
MVQDFLERPSLLVDSGKIAKDHDLNELMVLVELCVLL